MEITVHAKRVEPLHFTCFFVENFSGFHLQDKHNASILPKCLDESLGSSLQRYCKARENTNLFAVFRAAAYLHLAEQDKCSESFNTRQKTPDKKETPYADVPMSIKKRSMATHTPNTMLASICSLRLISRPIFKVGSLFPERYSLTREGLIPSSWVRLLCVVPPRRVLHCLCLLEVFLHIGSSGVGVHRRFLGFGDFLHLPLHGFFVKLIQIHHVPFLFLSRR